MTLCCSFSFSLTGASGSDTAEYTLAVTLTTAKLNTAQSTRQSPFEWVTHGWSKCSAHCGDGTQTITLRYVGQCSSSVLSTYH